jgi:alkylation response protein AidB-like acyl-CoA dehydrogenase
MGRDMFQELRDLAREKGVAHVEGVRRALCELYVQERVLALMGQRMRDALAQGREPGPEGSVAKIANAVLSRTAANTGMLIGGAAALAWEAGDDHGSQLADACLFSPMTAIAGGTTEIQRNTIGERVLGLPKEPQVDRDVAFKDVLQNPQRRTS